MKIGVVIPSRLALSHDGKSLWLEGALLSIGAQICFEQHDWYVAVGLDEGAKYPDSVIPAALEFTYVRAPSRGQSAAVGAAAREVVSHGVDVLAILEDDDRWHPAKMMMQLSRLEQAPFLSCSQQMVSEDQQKILGVNDYPIPSSWVMTSEIWKRVGNFDESVRYLVDTEWLGRLNQAKVPRIHLVENRDQMQTWHFQFSSCTSRHSEIVSTGLVSPLVTRTQNLAGGMCTISRDPKASAIADREQAMIIAKYGENPW